MEGSGTSKSEVFLEDTNWEDNNDQSSPSHPSAVTAARVATGTAAARTTVQDSSDQFETANESTDAFETANERGTETEDFQTGVEDMSSDELTETEAGPQGTIRSRPAPLALTQAGNRSSFQSTASTSGDEYSYEEAKTPTASQPRRLQLKISRGGNRRSRMPSDEPQFQSSPASFATSSINGTPQAGQSLFAELGNMSDEEDSVQGTPGRSTFASPSATPASRPSTAKGTPAPVFASPPVPKLPMVDSGVMDRSLGARTTDLSNCSALSF